MPLAAHSHWTITFFAVALALLALAEGLMVAGIGYPATDLAAPESLAVVHLVVIGWLSLAMAGALLQFVPVLVSRPLAFAPLALPVLVTIVVGLAALVAGFSVLAGWTDWTLDLIPVAGLLIIAGFTLLALMLAGTMGGAGLVQPFGRFVAVGLASLVAALASGTAFAAIFAGRADWLAAAGLLPEGTRFHALLGLGGWLGLTAFGVGYRLFAMFLLSPDPPRRRMAAVLACGAIGLLAAGAGLATLGAGLDPGDLVEAAAVGALALAALLHGRDLVMLYRVRHRKGLEINMRASIGAVAALGIGAALLPPAVIFGASERLVAALVFLLVFGWLSGLTLAQLVKIVSFMTWLEAYGGQIGRRRVPQVGTLVAMPRTAVWLALHFAGVVAGTLALAIGAAGSFRLAILACLAGTAGLAVEFVRIRRLCEIEPSLRPPDDAHPRILLRPRPPGRTDNAPITAPRRVDGQP